MATPQSRFPKPHPPQSIAELCQLRDSLHKEVDRLSMMLNWVKLVNASEYKKLIKQRQTLLKQIQFIDAQIQVNHKAEISWDKALEKAAIAAEMGRSLHPSIETWRQAQSLWKQALESLWEISPSAFFKTCVDKKIKEYKRHLSIATDELEKSQTKLLETTVKQSGLSPEAMITVCKLSGECRHWRGNQLVNPASLSKIPIAVALLHKISTEKISLNALISINPGNFTEDGDSQIQVQQRYTLKMLLMQMIAYSSNIASNQLIDYLGWDYIDQVLKNRGYRFARVSSKFMGEQIMPANPGLASNRFTSNELTRMMVEIYNRKHPGDEVLIEALKHQHDHALGFTAAKNSGVKWLGEKTGESSKVEGTTSAFNIAGEVYIVTVIDNRSDSDLTIRRCVAKLLNYIAQHSYL